MSDINARGRPDPASAKRPCVDPPCWPAQAEGVFRAREGPLLRRRDFSGPTALMTEIGSLESLWGDWQEPPGGRAHRAFRSPRQSPRGNPTCPSPPTSVPPVGGRLLRRGSASRDLESFLRNTKLIAQARGSRRGVGSYADPRVSRMNSILVLWVAVVAFSAVLVFGAVVPSLFLRSRAGSSRARRSTRSARPWAALAVFAVALTLASLAAIVLTDHLATVLAAYWAWSFPVFFFLVAIFVGWFFSSAGYRSDTKALAVLLVLGFGSGVLAYALQPIPWALGFAGVP